jgi:hypothetical protein
MLGTVGWQLVGDVTAQPLSPVFKGQIFQDWRTRPLKIRPIGCAEISVTNYQPTRRKVADEFITDCILTLPFRVFASSPDELLDCTQV